MLKKLMLSVLCLGVAFPALAKHGQKGFVFVPENVMIETVSNAKNKADDTMVVLQGQIVRALGHDKYAFTDQTGEIIVEIDSEDFDGMQVTAGEIIEITGEVDKEMMKPTEIDVKSIKKLNSNTMPKHDASKKHN